MYAVVFYVELLCLQIILNTYELGWLILNHCFPGSKTKVGQCLWFSLIVVEREREKANEVTVGVPDEEYKNICSVLSNFYVFEVFQN